jgi:hypothetical protein
MLRLGKLPARAGAVTFAFADFFDARKLPTPPPVFGHQLAVGDFHMLGNDTYSNCVWAGAAHETMIWSLEGGQPRARFLTKNTLADYAAVTGFDPHKPDSDQGTDMADAAKYRQKTGIVDATGKRHTVDGYVALKIGNFEQMLLATWIFGAAGIGLELPTQAMDQFDHNQVWTVPSKPKIEGGHYVSGVGRDRNGNLLIVTWGKTVPITPQFYERFSDEALAYISLEILGSKDLSPEGFDAAELRKHLSNLT